jgi:hypothetical protein
MRSKLQNLERWLAEHQWPTLDRAIEDFYGGVQVAPSLAEDKAAFFKVILTRTGELSAPAKAHLLDTAGSRGNAFYRQNRSPYDYAFSLVAGWLVEDAFYNLVSEDFGLSIGFSGDDEAREFKDAPGGSADFLVGGRSLELFTDFDGYWGSQGAISLKPAKFRRLQGEPDYSVLCLDLVRDRALLIRDMSHIRELGGGRVPGQTQNQRMGTGVYEIPAPERAGVWMSSDDKYGLSSFWD